MLRVFCDFDGTVAPVDIGNALFRHFAGDTAQQIARRYVDGEITARECLLSEAEAAGTVSPDELETFVRQFGLDEHFAAFREFCTANRIPLTILSDGLDFYVGRVLKDNGADGCSFYANHLEFVGTNGGTRMQVSFPYRDAECELCGNCKRNHMITGSGDDDIIVYAGDGVSDRCAVRYADIVFAKKGLVKYCQDQNISYYEFSDFRDIQRRLETLVGKKRLRKRREAEMARRDAFMQG
ncbi:MAG TPA: MtnX-like HAD-IB family phosphatase [Bacteroidota bacterium]|nr:MtnX-like HAD-IB family phosphatase [Bacteroidota bacterium]